MKKVKKEAYDAFLRPRTYDGAKVTLVDRDTILASNVKNAGLDVRLHRHLACWRPSMDVTVTLGGVEAVVLGNIDVTPEVKALWADLDNLALEQRAAARSACQDAASEIVNR
jgi:hypothetical protein